MTKIRGGRQAYDRLLADVQVVETALRDAKSYATRPKLVEDVADDGLLAVRALRTLITDVIGPMLDRIETRANPRELAELAQLIYEQGRRIEALEARVTQLDLDRRGVTPFRKQERG